MLIATWRVARAAKFPRGFRAKKDQGTTKDRIRRAKNGTIAIFCAVFDAHISSLFALKLYGSACYTGYLEGYN